MLREVITLLLSVVLAALLAYHLGVRAERGRWERWEHIRQAQIEREKERPGLRLRRMKLHR